MERVVLEGVFLVVAVRVVSFVRVFLVIFVVFRLVRWVFGGLGRV